MRPVHCGQFCALWVLSVVCASGEPFHSVYTDGTEQIMKL